MDNNPIEKIQAHENSSHKANVIRYADTLKPGSSVLVRIIGARGNNAYEGSVAGVRLIIHSKENLKPGDSFKGIIGLKNGLITITPADIAEKTLIRDISIQNSVSSPAITSLLAALNLPQDELSYNLLLQFKQLGMKMDPILMKKIRREAEKSDDPQNTIEELTNKAQKKIRSIRTQSNSSNAFFQDSKNPENSMKPSESSPSSFEISGMSGADWLSEIKNFINNLTDGTLPNEAGELTLLNHCGFFTDKSSENTWITLPFEITNPFEETTTGNGKIMLLLGSSDKQFRQMNLHVDFQNKKWRFIINRDMTNISYSVQGVQNAEEKTVAIQNHFLQQGKTVSVHWVPFDKINGNGALLEDFKIIEGHA